MRQVENRMDEIKHEVINPMSQFMEGIFQKLER